MQERGFFLLSYLLQWGGVLLSVDTRGVLELRGLDNNPGL